MTRTQRHYLLIGAITIFIILVPLVILYSLGYTFDFGNRTIVTTGGIFVKSFPKGIKVYLDDTLVEEHSDFGLGSGILLKDLPEKDYAVRVERDGHHTWQKTVTVKGGFVNESKFILLLEKNPAVKVAPYAKLEDIRYPAEKLRTIEKTLGVRTPEFQAEPRSRTLYFVTRGKLYQLNELTNNATLIASNVLTFTYYPHGLYYLTSEGTLFVYDDGETRRIGAVPAATSKNPWLAIRSREGGPLGVNYYGTLYLLNEGQGTFEKIDENVETFEFDQKTDKMLYLKHSNLPALRLNELWVYFFEGRVQPLISPGDKELLYSTTATVESPFWFGPDEEHIIFKKGGEGVLVTETDTRGGQNTVRWINGNVQEIYYDIETKTFYYSENSKVYSITFLF